MEMGKGLYLSFQLSEVAYKKAFDPNLFYERLLLVLNKVLDDLVIEDVFERDYIRDAVFDEYFPHEPPAYLKKPEKWYRVITNKVKTHQKKYLSARQEELLHLQNLFELESNGTGSHLWFSHKQVKQCIKSKKIVSLLVEDDSLVAQHSLNILAQCDPHVIYDIYVRLAKCRQSDLKGLQIPKAPSQR